MIVAGLIAEGTTEISGVHFIRRGYEKKRKPGDLFIDDVSVTDEELGGK